MVGMKRHKMHNLQELEEVSKHILPWACREHSPEGSLTVFLRSPCSSDLEKSNLVISVVFRHCLLQQK
jgi:hypothetical protein